MAEKVEHVSGRSYNEYCAVARGMDVIGERWTLLLVRELLLGPKRYKDLLTGLPGIGTNLLAARLRELEAWGLVRRGVLPPPAGSAVYELTDAGQELEPVMAAIGRWGFRFMDAPRATDTLVPSAYFVALRASFRPEAAAGLKQRFELRVGGRVFEVRVEDGRCTTREGRTSDPDVVLAMEVETLNALLFNQMSADEAIAQRRVQLEGDPAALNTFISVFAFRPRIPPTTQH